jgi:hypothetical protein
MSINKFIVSAAITAGAFTVGGFGAEPAHAAISPAGVLEVLCEAKGGSFYVTPYAKARCQETTPRAGERGLWAERLICDRLLEGTFNVAPSYGAPAGHFTWVCV